MTDNPEELNQIEEALFNLKPEGRVLVGGLGLGIMARRVASLPGVDEIVVVEKNLDVIKLCANKGVGWGYDVEHADIKDFLQRHVDPFDFYLLDTWAGTGEATWWEEVMPLRRTIRNRFGAKPVVHCWAEDIMLGQVRQVLQGEARFWKYENLPRVMDVDDFLQNVGLPQWEERYGKLLV